jgi:hypothetical protein
MKNNTVHKYLEHILSLWQPYLRNPLSLRKVRKGKGIKPWGCPTSEIGKPEL